ncbi:hypothetical protein EG028_09840 [Chitinophaga barathri]|uniref:Uncharacterized protein n=1 Tax=Chitinophaga barathri TaxID=1647451 RepID=A0A3N4MDF9_9BACT|nr:hypothetical protein EG028_09840 [Chitinophaga barathri]
MLFIIRSAKIAEIQERRKSAINILNFCDRKYRLPGLMGAGDEVLCLVKQVFLRVLRLKFNFTFEL